MIYTEESEVDVNSLKEVIANVEVSDAILVYNLLVKKGTEIPAELKQSLLELLCFYNHENTLADDLIEERWFGQSSMGKERLRKTWKDGDLAELLFSEIESATVQSYCAIIRGMCKYLQVERAYALFQEALDKNLDLDVATYNSIIQVVNFLKESGEMRWELGQEIMRTMASRGVRPNLDTLNASLFLITTIGGYRQSRTFALQILAEFKELSIKPSLASWFHILSIFCRERGPVSHVLVDILNQIEGQEFKIQNTKDTYFFVTAMSVCRNLNDKTLANRLNNLVNHANNYDLIGDSYKESVYYRNYFALLCLTETIDAFMEQYNRYVPNIYTPEPGIMSEILKMIDVNGAVELIPRLWSDMVVFDHTNREGLLQQIVKIMVENKPDPELTNHIGLDEKFNTIVWQIWEKIENQQENRTNQITWTGQLLGDVLFILCRNEDFEKANLVFIKLYKEEHKYSGNPNPATIEAYVDLAIVNKQPSKAITALQFYVESSFGDGQLLGKKIANALTLDENHLSKISTLVGNVIDQ